MWQPDPCVPRFWILPQAPLHFRRLDQCGGDCTRLQWYSGVRLVGFAGLIGDLRILGLQNWATPCTTTVCCFPHFVPVLLLAAQSLPGLDFSFALRVQSTQIWSIYDFGVRNCNYMVQGLYFLFGYLDP